MIVEGNPAEVRAVNTIALNRWGYSPQEIDAIKDAYKRLYRDNGAAMTDKVVALRQAYQNVPAITTLCDALSATSVGVHGRALEVKRPDDKRAKPVVV
jgi:acyl-[acyl carrier protein]--UDP-N-acetylglucosamine O-acyltransferase